MFNKQYHVIWRHADGETFDTVSPPVRDKTIAVNLIKGYLPLSGDFCSFLLVEVYTPAVAHKDERIITAGWLMNEDRTGLQKINKPRILQWKNEPRTLNGGKSCRTWSKFKA